MRFGSARASPSLGPPTNGFVNPEVFTPRLSLPRKPPSAGDTMCPRHFGSRHRCLPRIMTANFACLPTFRYLALCGVLLVIAAGCGTTRDKLATEQLLLSDAVDRAVARIDFSPLKGEKV